MGGVVRFGSTVKGNVILSGNFTNNSAKTYGGVAHFGGAVDSSANITLSGTFTGNKASNSGGVVYFANTVGTVTFNGTFTGNKASNSGGVVYFVNTVSAATFKGTYENNSAVSGSLIYLAKDSTSGSFTIDYAKLENNMVDAGSYAIVLPKMGNFNIKNSNFTNNDIYVTNFNDDYVILDNTWNNSSVLPKKVLYEDNVKFNSSKNRVWNNVDVATININTPSGIYVGDDCVITISINVPGEVTLKVNVTGLPNQEITNDSTSIIIPLYDIAQGTYDVSVIFEGDDEYNEASATRSFTVDYASFTQLSSLIGSGSDTTIDLPYDYVWKSNEGSVVISGSNVIINGNGHFIDAQDSSSIFTITGNNVTINNLTLINGFAMSDGAAVSWSGANGTVKNTNFTDNQAQSGNGGGLYVTGDNLTIDTCTFTGNVANKGAAIYIKADETDIVSCSFVDCKSINGGAVYFEGDNLTVSNSTFESNQAVNGSSITAVGNGTSLGNVTVSDGKDLEGSGIDITGDDAVIDEVNVTDSNGKGMTVSGNNNTINNTNVSGNSGDGITVNGNGNTVSNSNITDNNGTGLVNNGNNNNVTDSTITDNLNGVEDNGDNSTISGNTIANNTDTGLIVNGNDTNVTGNTFDDNGNGDIGVSQDSNMDTDDKKQQMNNDNYDADVRSTPVLVVEPIADITYGNTVISIVVNYNGTYNVTVGDGIPIPVENVIAGEAKDVHVDVLAVGNYTVKVQFLGNENYTACEVETNLTVNQATPILPVSVISSTYPEVVVRVEAPVAGTYTVTIGGKSNETHVDAGGPVDILISGLAVNSSTPYSIVVVGIPDDSANYTDMINDTVTVSVDKAAQDIIVSADPVDYGTPVSVNVTAPVDGTYTVTINGISNSSDMLAGEQKLIEIYGLAANVTGYIINVTGTPVDTQNYTINNNTSVSVIVNPKNNPVTLTINNIVYGGPVHVVISGAVVAGVYNVTLADGQFVEVAVSEVSAGVFNGSADANWVLAVGNDYSASVSLVNANYTTSGGDEFNVTAKDNAVSLTINNVVYGRPVAVSISNAKVAGTFRVTLTDGKYVDVTVSEVSAGVFEGSADANWNLNAGTGYSASVSLDNANYNTSGSDTFDVTPAESTIVINSIAGVTYPDDVVVTYTTNSAVSAVVVYVKGTTTQVGSVTRGTNQVTVSGLGAGTYTIKITVKDANHAENSATKDFTVNPASSTIEDIAPVTVVYGEGANVTVVTTGATGITAELLSGDSPVQGVSVDGNVISIADNIDAGTYTLVVTTLVDANHKNTSASAVLNVAKASSLVELSDNITVSLDGSIDVALDKLVNASTVVASLYNESGEVKVLNVVDNVIIVDVSGLGEGSYTLKTTTVTDKNHANMTAESIVNVLEGYAQLEIFANSSIKVDDSLVVNVTVTSKATGNVVITVNGKSQTVELVDAKGSAVFDGFTAGTYTILAEYSGDVKYDADNATSEFTVSNYNAADLQALIDEAIANNETEIILEHDYVFDENDTVPVTIDGTISIKGNDHTIDANGTEGIFDITADDVSLDDLVLTGVNGTAVSSSGNNTQISDITLTDNEGTGIDVKGDNAVINNVEISDNNGTGISVSGNGADIDDVVISDSTGTGLDVSGDDTTISGVDISGNEGTGISVSGNGADIDDVTVSGSTGTGISVSGDDTTISGIDISGNEGTGISVSGDNATVDDVTVSDSTGTGLDVSGDDSTISGVDISGNEGTGISVSGSGAEVSDVNVTDSTGTGLDVSGDDTTISGVDISVNDGTGINVTGAGADISDVEINYSNGTGLDVSGDGATISGVGISGNEGTGISVSGDNATVGDVEITDSTGTGLDVSGDDSTISGVDISGNEGTGINVTGSGADIDDVTVSDSTGTGLDVSGDDSTISGVDIFGNNGTGISVSGNGAEVSDVNVTDSTGTGLDFYGDDSTISGVDISGNEGTGINVTGSGADIDDVEITDSTGTGLDVSGGNTTINDVVISGNEGTGISVSGNDTTIEDISVSGSNGTGIEVNGDGASVSGVNLTDNNGTGMAVNGDGASLDDVEVTGNNGTAVEINGDDTVLENSTFTGNTGVNGAGVVVNGDGASVSNTTFADNTAETGAGIVINGNGANVTDSTFTNNTAESGAGIVANGNGTAISGSTFENNTAETGAGVVVNGEGTSVSDSEFTGNNATDSGAAIAVNPGVEDVAVDNVTSSNNTVNDKEDDTVVSYESSIVIVVADAIEGQPVTVTVNVAGAGSSAFDGNVSITVGNYKATESVVDGKAVFTVSDLKAGIYTVKAVYSGDSIRDDSQADATFTIFVKSTIVAADITRGYNSPYDFIATFTDELGNPLVNAGVSFIVDGVTYNATTDESGVAYFKATLPLVNDSATAYDVVVVNTVTGENASFVTTIVPRLIVVSGDLTADYLCNPPYIVQAIGDDGNPVGAGVTVKVVFAGFAYDLVTNATGHVVRTIGLAPGMYAVRGEYMGYKAPQTVFTVKQVMKVTSGTIKKSAKSYTLKATLKYSNGKAIKGKVVKLTFNGKTYSVKTNSKGVASYTIRSGVINKLKAGKTYVLKAKYVNDLVKGKIKVKK